MTPLLEQFISETREFLLGIGEKLMQLEEAPEDAGVMIELFRLVHTLKGNSGLFDFPEMTRVLHAGEDLMDAVRDGRIPYSQALADKLLDAMDFVGRLCDEVELTDQIDPASTPVSASLSAALRALRSSSEQTVEGENVVKDIPLSTVQSLSEPKPKPELAEIPEAIRMDAYRRAVQGVPIFWLTYVPDEECFFQGDDPFFSIRQVADFMWGRIVPRASWPALAELDAYRCALDFQVLTSAQLTDLSEHFRYVPDQVRILTVDSWELVLPTGITGNPSIQEDFVADTLTLLDDGDFVAIRLAAQSMLGLSNPDLWTSSALRWLLFMLDIGFENIGELRILLQAIASQAMPDLPVETALLSAGPTNAHQPLAPLSAEGRANLDTVFATQRTILLLQDKPTWETGRVTAAAGVLVNCCQAMGDTHGAAAIDLALQHSLKAGTNEALLASMASLDCGDHSLQSLAMPTEGTASGEPSTPIVDEPALAKARQESDGSVKFVRRVEDAATGPKSLKVEQVKIDLLMNLIGEMVVAKNAMPYLAQRAEDEFGVRELSREIKTQYAVINRIAEEMQSAIM